MTLHVHGSRVLCQIVAGKFIDEFREDMQTLVKP